MITWPDGKSFAFTVFDDTDSAVKGNYERVYALLRDEGLQTTKSVWPLRGNGKAIKGGSTCEDADYRTHMLELQRDGFEIGYHGTTYHTVERAEIQRGLKRFYEIFGHHPRTMANHFGVAEGIYWGDARLSGAYRFLYNAFTRARNKDAFFGHQEGSPYFWGDLCRDHIVYVRNFTTSKINTLKAFPLMPYHDPARKFVQQWFSSSEGPEVSSFVRTISEHNQDRLELEGGACIMYTHFAFGFQDGSGAIDQRFRMLIKRLSKKNGWFVPVATLLDYIRRQRGEHILAPAERSRMERNWLIHKIFSGTA